MTALVTAPSQAPRGGPIGPWAEWWLILSISCVVVLTVAGILLARHRTRLRAALEKQKQYSPIKDAWAEAGRRAEPATVDIDPDDVQER